MRAIDVADFFIEVLKNEKTKTTNIKLNKLVSFTQGYYLAQYGKPLFDEDIEAWSLGFVVPSIYHTFKQFKDDRVQPSNRELPNFTEEELSILTRVAITFGKYAPSRLVDINHEECNTWKKYYKSDEKNIVIPKKEIEAEFKTSFRPLCEDIDFEKLPKVGYIDEEGYTVLPKEYD